MLFDCKMCLHQYKMKSAYIFVCSVLASFWAIHSWRDGMHAYIKRRFPYGNGGTVKPFLAFCFVLHLCHRLLFLPILFSKGVEKAPLALGASLLSFTFDWLIQINIPADCWEFQIFRDVEGKMLANIFSFFQSFCIVDGSERFALKFE